jgi:hypothetical protein
MRPLIIGDRKAKVWLVSESQWDAFAIMDALEFYIDGYEPSYAVIVTRGADTRTEWMPRSSVEKARLLGIVDVLRKSGAKESGLYVEWPEPR